MCVVASSTSCSCLVRLAIVLVMPPQHSPRLHCLPAKTPNVIRQYRLRLGLTQREVAGLLAVRPTTVSAWERGLTCPSAALVLRLAKVLNTLAEALYPQFYVPRKRESDATAS